MLLRRITDFILQGRLQAMGTAFICAFLPLVGTVSVLIAALVTLRKGVQEGALVLVAATLPVLISYAGFPVDSAAASYTVSPANAVSFVVIINVLTWLYAVVLRRYPSWSLVIQLAGFVAVVTVVAVHIAYPDVRAWWQDWLTNYFGHVEQEAGQLSAEDVKANKAMIGNVVASIAPYATGIIAAIVSFYALLQLLLARWWQAAMFNPGGLRKELLVIRMSYAAGAVFVLGLVLSYWSSALIVDVMPVLYLVFGLAGFSLLHSIANNNKASWFLFALVYIVITVIPTAVILIAMAALLDTWLDFRKRFQKQI